MKRFLIGLGSVMMLLVAYALITGITYGAQVLFFTLILLFLALIIRMVQTAFRGTPKDRTKGHRVA
ncbi:MAG: hypothetical protein ACO1NQ_08195 [Flavobacteriales bacterium]